MGWTIKENNSVHEVRGGPLSIGQGSFPADGVKAGDGGPSLIPRRRPDQRRCPRSPNPAATETRLVAPTAKSAGLPPRQSADEDDDDRRTTPFRPPVIIRTPISRGGRRRSGGIGPGGSPTAVSSWEDARVQPAGAATIRQVFAELSTIHSDGNHQRPAESGGVLPFSAFQRCARAPHRGSPISIAVCG